jgi:hypothetical protein
MKFLIILIACLFITPTLYADDAYLVIKRNEDTQTIVNGYRTDLKYMKFDISSKYTIDVLFVTPNETKRKQVTLIPNSKVEISENEDTLIGNQMQELKPNFSVFGQTQETKKEDNSLVSKLRGSIKKQSIQEKKKEIYQAPAPTPKFDGSSIEIYPNMMPIYTNPPMMINCAPGRG